MNSYLPLTPDNHITRAARRTHTKVVALYGPRWDRIRRPYISLICAARNIGPSPAGIMDTARTLKRMAVTEDLDETPEFIMAAAVEIVEGRAS